MKKITTQGLQIYTFQKNESDYISLTDIAKYKNKDEPADIVKNWMRSRSTIEYLGFWEKINNQSLNWSNSTSLEMRLVLTVLCCLRISGLRQRMQLGLFQNLGVIAEVLLHIKTLLLNLPHGYHPNLSYI